MTLGGWVVTKRDNYMRVKLEEKSVAHFHKNVVLKLTNFIAIGGKDCTYVYS